MQSVVCRILDIKHRCVSAQAKAVNMAVGIAVEADISRIYFYTGVNRRPQLVGRKQKRPEGSSGATTLEVSPPSPGCAYKERI